LVSNTLRQIVNRFICVGGGSDNSIADVDADMSRHGVMGPE